MFLLFFPYFIIAQIGVFFVENRAFVFIFMTLEIAALDFWLEALEKAEVFARAQFRVLDSRAFA